MEIPPPFPSRAFQRSSLHLVSRACFVPGMFLTSPEASGGNRGSLISPSSLLTPVCSNQLLDCRDPTGQPPLPRDWGVHSPKLPALVTLPSAPGHGIRESQNGIRKCQNGLGWGTLKLILFPAEGHLPLDQPAPSPAQPGFLWDNKIQEARLSLRAGTGLGCITRKSPGIQTPLPFPAVRPSVPAPASPCAAVSHVGAADDEFSAHFIAILNSVRSGEWLRVPGGSEAVRVLRITHKKR